MPSTKPLNPLLTYKFQIYFADEGGTPLLGMTRMSRLGRQIRKVGFHTGGQMRSPAAELQLGVAQEAVTFEQGICLSDGRLEGWVRGAAGGHAAPRDLRVDVMNAQGEIASSYVLAACRVSEYRALTELDAQRSGVTGIAVLTVQPVGWRRAEKAG